MVFGTRTEAGVVGSNTITGNLPTGKSSRLFLPCNQMFLKDYVNKNSVKFSKAISAAERRYMYTGMFFILLSQKSCVYM